ncbi:MAG TPA: thioredoxin-disulfide reductase [Candidatus Eisenbergiella merdigallinarum]|uniref:Thioredoxin reductase n=1 Tax=Candidatus Eisenbergiella merdigallinarum TaxID=2838552 RepID=A0A9D2MU10_9FIRM|nr:thioredoxin-disulfide reductase [Candidatus Eisenbergiella merdigallinarum]
MYDLIVIGSGPAGLGAAVYGKRAGLSTLVLEQAPMSGGQILNTWEVDNYLGLPGISGFDMGMQFREHAEKLGTQFREAEVTGVENGADRKIVKTSEGDFEAGAVIIATGAAHRKLGVPGEERLSGMGVSYCATCDGAFFRDRTVAVIGGGDVAVEDAIFLARGCKKVYVVHRRDELRAAKSLQDQLFALPNVEMVWNCTVNDILGEDAVTGLSLHDKKEGKDRELAVDGVFVAVGISPNSAAFAGVVKADENGWLEAGEDCATSVPGIFAAGDVRTKKLRQVITAVADGANAVASAQEYFLKRKG